MQKNKKFQTIAIIAGGILGTCFICGMCGLIADSIDSEDDESATKVVEVTEIISTTTDMLPTDTLTQVTDNLTPEITDTFLPDPTGTLAPVLNVTNTIIPTQAESMDGSIPVCIPAENPIENATVTSITDGDTIEVSMDSTLYKVRYIGIDTPEDGEEGGDAATAKNAELVSGKEILMVRDVNETDRYGRLLRYVIVGDTFVNQALVESGFAIAKEYPPDTACAITFKQAMDSAISSRQGLWDITPATQDIQVTSEPIAGGSSVSIAYIFYNGVVSDKEPDEYVIIRNDGAESVQLQGWRLSDESGKTFIFPNFEITPGQECRVYTNEIHPEFCGFSFGHGGSAIWNNGGDCAMLHDAQGNLVNQKCY
jgi:endonuclease YncB( thermonuclease family)